MKKLEEIWPDSHMKGIITPYSIRQLCARILELNKHLLKFVTTGLPKLKHKYGLESNVCIVQFGLLRV